MGGLITWYMSTGTAAVPGWPVALPVTVERGALGAAQAAWQAARRAWREPCAEAPPQAAIEAASNASQTDLTTAVLTYRPAYRFQRR